MSTNHISAVHSLQRRLSATLRIYSVDLSDSFFHNASVGNVYMAIYFARRILWKVWPTLVRILFAPILLNPPAA
jgi:hypothetical protein